MDTDDGRLQRIGPGRWGSPAGRTSPCRARCRHQFADLSRGRVDAEGCLVCPWHGSRYDVTDGRMVTAARAACGGDGPTPGYTGLVRAFGRVARLRVGHVRRHGDRVEVQ